jgi:CDP-L-myo-inositol myo-inositolphosphotransferase
LIERVIRSAVEAHIEEFFVVTGYRGEVVRPFLDDLARRCGIRLTHIVNDEWEQGNGISVLKAKEVLREPFLLLMGDHLVEPSILKGLTEYLPNDGEIVLAVDRNVRNGLVDLTDVTRVWTEDGQVRDIGKGLEPYNGFDTGIFLCSPSIFDALEEIRRETEGEIALSDAVRLLGARGKVRVFDIGDQFWVDIDSPEDVDKAERVLLKRLAAKGTDGPVARYLNRPFSIRLSRWLSRLPVTPNQLSVGVFLVSMVAAVLFFFPGYLPLLVGGVIAQTASILDGCDGEVARLKFQRTEYGGWLDAVLDRYADAFLLMGLTWHASENGAKGLPLIIGFLALIGSFMVSYTAHKHDALMKDFFSKGRAFRIGRDIRLFLIFLGALFNQPFLVLGVIAVVMNMETLRRIVICRRFA